MRTIVILFFTALLMVSCNSKSGKITAQNDYDKYLENKDKKAK